MIRKTPPLCDAARYSAVKWSTQSRCAVFSIIGVTLALVAYVYARLCCQEDAARLLVAVVLMVLMVYGP